MEFKVDKNLNLYADGKLFLSGKDWDDYCYNLTKLQNFVDMFRRSFEIKRVIKDGFNSDAFNMAFNLVYGDDSDECQLSEEEAVNYAYDELFQ